MVLAAGVTVHTAGHQSSLPDSCPLSTVLRPRGLQEQLPSLCLLNVFAEVRNIFPDSGGFLSDLREPKPAMGTDLCLDIVRVFAGGTMKVVSQESHV